MLPKRRMCGAHALGASAGWCAGECTRLLKGCKRDTPRGEAHWEGARLLPSTAFLCQGVTAWGPSSLLTAPAPSVAHTIASEEFSSA